MYRKLIPIISIIILMFVVSNSFAINYDWKNTSGDRKWSTPENWDPCGVPTENDNAYVDANGLGAGPIIDTAAKCNNLFVGNVNDINTWPTEPNLVTGGSLECGTIGLYIGVDSDVNSSGGMATMNVQGGSYYGGWIIIGQWGTGTLNMSGGTMSYHQALSIGRFGTEPSHPNSIGTGTFNLSDGYLIKEDPWGWASVGGEAYAGGVGYANVTGGYWLANRFIVGREVSAIGHVQLDGGTMESEGDICIGEWPPGTPVVSDASWDITNGILLCQSNQVATANRYAGRGWLTAHGGRGNLSIEWDGTLTTIFALPLDPNQAWGPDPMSGLDIPGQNPTLSWNRGDNPADVNGHYVYFGTTFEEVNEANSAYIGVFRGAQDAGPAAVNDVNSYTPPETLIRGETYYWRIDEVNGATTWKGTVWNFTVRDYLLIDDFESYLDKSSSEPNLYGFWQDGRTDATGGFGNPFNRAYIDLVTDGETKPVHLGDQSMQVGYKANEALGMYAEIRHVYDSAQNWSQTNSNVQSLAFFFHGVGTNEDHQPLMYVKLEDSSGKIGKVNYSGDPNIVNHFWEPWNEWYMKLSDFEVNSLSLANIKKITIGFHSRSGAYSDQVMYLDDIRLYIPVCREDEVPGTVGGCTAGLSDLSIMRDYWLDSNSVATATPPDNNNLIVWYKFDEVSGDTAADSALIDANAVAGKYDANTSIDGNAAIWNASGYSNGCIDFNGGYHMIAPNSVWNDYFDNNQATVSLWINGNEPCQPRISNCNFLVESDGTFASRFAGYVPWGESIAATGPYGSVTMIFIAAYNWWRVYAPDIRPEDWEGSWDHYAFVYDATATSSGGRAGKQSIYHNGKLMGQTAWNDPLIVPGEPITKFLIGGEGNYVGKIDEFKLFNYALSQGEVMSLAGVGGSMVQPLIDHCLLYDAADADLNNDQIVNFKDFALMADIWVDDEADSSNAILWP